MNHPDPRWMTVADICADLHITQDEWAHWQARCQTPLHATGPDGQLRVRASHYQTWLDNLPRASTDDLLAAMDDYYRQHPDANPNWWADDEPPTAGGHDSAS